MMCSDLSTSEEMPGHCWRSGPAITRRTCRRDTPCNARSIPFNLLNLVGGTPDNLNDLAALEPWVPLAGRF
jgi:hypothetical protein